MGIELGEDEAGEGCLKRGQAVPGGRDRVGEDFGVESHCWKTLWQAAETPTSPTRSVNWELAVTPDAGVVKGTSLLSFSVGLVGRMVHPAVRFMGRQGILLSRRDPEQ